MTLLWDHTGQGATDEADVNITDTIYGSQWNVVSKTASVTIKYDNVHAWHSGTSIRFVRPAAADVGYCLGQLGSAVTRMQVCEYWWIDALPTSLQSPWVFRSTGFMGYVSFNLPAQAAGRLGLRNSAGTGINASVAPADFPLSQWVRVEAAITASATIGRIEFAYYLGDSLTAEHSYDTGAVVNTGAANPQGVRFGVDGTTNVPGTWWRARQRLGDGASGFLGPVVDLPILVMPNRSA